MSTTFAVEVNGEEINVALRGNRTRWLSPLAALLPNDTPLIATDNTSQGIEVIGDFKRLLTNK